MAKQLNVSLAFTANTNEAIAQVKALQKELNGLATGVYVITVVSDESTYTTRFIKK